MTLSKCLSDQPDVVIIAIIIGHGIPGHLSNAIQQQAPYLPARPVAGAPQVSPLLLRVPGAAEARSSLVPLKKLIQTTFRIVAPGCGPGI